jgi:hypothetical protein
MNTHERNGIPAQIRFSETRTTRMPSFIQLMKITKTSPDPPRPPFSRDVAPQGGLLMKNPNHPK